MKFCYAKIGAFRLAVYRHVHIWAILVTLTRLSQETSMPSKFHKGSSQT